MGATSAIPCPALTFLSQFRSCECLQKNGQRRGIKRVYAKDNYDLDCIIKCDRKFYNQILNEVQKYLQQHFPRELRIIKQMH